jgi:aryl carrier-like protein
VATADSRPDRICALLPAISSRKPGASSYQDLYHQLRQAEPFRTGGWNDRHRGERYADALFMQWRLAHHAGHPLSPQAAAFARSLLALAHHAEALGPDRDGLRQGLDDLRVIAAAVRLRQQLGPRGLPETVYRLMESGTSMLERLADAARPKAHQEREPVGSNHRHYRIATALALGLLTGALALLGRPVLAALHLAPSTESLAAALYLGVGLLAVWLLARRGSS